MWPEDPPIPRGVKIEKFFLKSLLAAFILPFVIYGGAKLYEFNHVGTIFAIVEQTKRITYAVEEFRERYHFLPGDLPNAGKILPGCPGVNGSDCDPFPETAGDGIIGNKDFSKNLRVQASRATIPATSAADETTLFWAHLYYAGLLDAKDLSWFDETPPASIKTKMGGRFVVGYMDGTALPENLQPSSGNPPKGVVLMMVSKNVLYDGEAMDASGKQTLGGATAGSLGGGKMDDSDPVSGWIQAYGAPNCFAKGKDFRTGNDRTTYNYVSEEKDCNVIFWIFWEHDGKLEPKWDKKDR